MIRALSIFFILLTSNSAYGVTAKSTVILLSVDGFSYNYLQKYQPKNLLSFAKSGVSARLLPVYPSKTFPNHLSIITGSYPVNHGIIHNNFFQPKLDQKYYKGAGKSNDTWVTAAPFWSVVEDNHIKSAVYFWPESESIGHTAPSYNIPYNNSASNKDRIEKLIAWLKLPNNKRPHFIASYFSTIDSAGHHYGIESAELISAINEFDQLFGYFLDKIESEIDHPVNIILVSDHGMMPITKESAIYISSVFENMNTVSEGVTITYSDTQIFVYFDKNKIANKSITEIENKLISNQSVNKGNYRLYAKGHYPKHWHLNSDLVVVPDIVIEAIAPATFRSKKTSANFNRGTHGFDPKNNELLDGLFIASGPNLVEGRILEPFKNIHVFPLMNTLLGLNENRNIDGQKSVLESITK